MPTTPNKHEEQPITSIITNSPTNWSDLISVFGYGYVWNMEQYKYIVKVRGYTDMQPRTIKALREFRANPENDKKLNDILDDLAAKLYSFVIKEPAKTRIEFDDWHEKTGMEFVNRFNAAIAGTGVDSIAFGKAQKIINVSLKYIYCLKGADQYLEKFRHCHMTLGRYTYSEGFYPRPLLLRQNSTYSNIMKKN